MLCTHLGEGKTSTSDSRFDAQRNLPRPEQPNHLEEVK